MMYDEDRLLISDSLEGQVDFEEPVQDEEPQQRVVYLTLISSSGQDAVSMALSGAKIGKNKVKFEAVARLEDVLSLIITDSPKFSAANIELDESSRDIDISGHDLVSVSYKERQKEQQLCDATFVFKKILKV